LEISNHIIILDTFDRLTLSPLHVDFHVHIYIMQSYHLVFDSLLIIAIYYTYFLFVSDKCAVLREEKTASSE